MSNFKISTDLEFIEIIDGKVKSYGKSSNAFVAVPIKHKGKKAKVVILR